MRKYTYSEIRQLINELKEIFDVARLVDVENCREVEVDGESLQELGACFARLKNNVSCANCSSRKALLAQEKTTKYEMVENKVLFVHSFPITLCGKNEEKDLVLELISIRESEKWLKNIEDCHPIDLFIAQDKQLYVDSLTKAYNRRYYDDCIFLDEPYVRNASRLTLIFADLHGFKKINDTYGHLVGDDVLTRCVPLMKKCVRPHDMVVRMGGDEFLIILPDCPYSAAERIVNDVHALFLEELYATPARDTFVDIDMGISSVENFELSLPFIENMRAEADREMYKNKVGKYNSQAD